MSQLLNHWPPKCPDLHLPLVHWRGRWDSGSNLEHYLQELEGSEAWVRLPQRVRDDCHRLSDRLPALRRLTGSLGGGASLCCVLRCTATSALRGAACRAWTTSCSAACRMARFISSKIQRISASSLSANQCFFGFQITGFF